MTVGLIIALALLGFELIVMFQKHHFLNLLVFLGVLSHYFLSYFDSKYIKLVLFLLGLSIILDSVWLAVMTQVPFL